MTSPKTADYPLWLAHEHMRLHLPHYTPGHNVHDTVSAALASQPAQAETVLPDVLFDGYAVLQSLPEKAKARTSAENVSDVLDAVVKLIRATPPQAQPAPVAPACGHGFTTPLAKALQAAWIDGFESRRDSEFIGEEAMNDAFNRCRTLSECLDAEQQVPAPVAVDERELPPLPTGKEFIACEGEPAPGHMFSFGPAREWFTADQMRAYALSARSGQDGGDAGGAPVLYASPEQLQGAIAGTLQGFSQLRPETGGYLPVRTTACGKFTAPLYTTPQAAVSASQAVGDEPEPVLLGRFHHGQGFLCSGSMRVMREDFDTNPSAEFQQQFFDWVCEVMNAHLRRAALAANKEQQG